MTTEPAAHPAVKAVLARRSARAGYRAEPVSREMLEVVLRCGLAAPSSKNAQPWRLHVVDTPGLLREFADAMVTADGASTYVPHDPRTGEPDLRFSSTVAESAEVLRSVPVAVFIENLGVFTHGRATLAAAGRQALAGSLIGYGFELVGIGAALENMWIAATALGLGAAFMGDVTVAESFVSVRLGLKGDLVGVLVLGHLDSAARQPPPADRPSDDPRVWWHTTQ